MAEKQRTSPKDMFNNRIYFHVILVPRSIDFVHFISGRGAVFGISRKPVTIETEDTIHGTLRLSYKTKEIFCIARTYLSEVHSCNNNDGSLNYTTCALIKIQLNLKGNRTRVLWV